ncbi:MAG: TetR/AcrR family transcriptional regulator [Flavobacteriaceae bacterium]
MAWKSAVLSRSEQRKLKREALLREAAAAFNRRGFHATSLDDLASNLGVTKAALYYYFPNKQKLLLACIERVMEAAFRSMERARKEGVTGREKLHLSLRYYLQEIIDELSCCVVITEERSLLPEDLAPHIAMRDRYEKALREFVLMGIEDGSIAPGDPKLIVFTLLGAVNWVPKWFSQNGEWSSNQVATAMTELLDRAIAAVPEPSLTVSVKDIPRRA